MKPEFRFRLNGIFMPEIHIQRAMVGGEPIGDLEIAVKDETMVDGKPIGWFVIDDNSALPDKDLPHFVLEYRDETAWALIPASERRTMQDKGWYTTTPQELIGILESTGVIE